MQVDLLQLFHKCAYEIEYDTIGDSVNYKFIEDGRTLYIFFEGSNSITDWVENFMFTHKLYKEFRVHKGFYRAYSQVRELMLDKAMEEETTYELHNDGLESRKVTRYRFDNIIVVGYSHGGALCQLAHEDIVYHLPSVNVQSYAFESPRCLKVPKKYRDRWQGLMVIRNGTDIVTHCPPKIFGYTDLGMMYKIKGDTALVENKLPNFVKYHYPQCVEDGLANDNA